MRRFDDAEGREWEAVIGRESWGSFVVIFVPVGGSAAPRQAPLRATGHEEASAELARMEAGELAALLQQAPGMDIGGEESDG